MSFGGGISYSNGDIHILGEVYQVNAESAAESTWFLHMSQL